MQVQRLETKMHRLISEKRAELAQICRKFHVKSLEVFGSVARGADFNTTLSDADFLGSTRTP